MNDSRQHKTKLEFAQSLGISPATLYRRIRALGLLAYLDGRLLSPSDQSELQAALDKCKEKSRPPGIEPDPPDGAVTQIDTD